jgi:hypothetical protein
MSGLEVLLVVAAIGYVIYQQLAGQPLRRKDVVMLPAILTIIGFSDLYGTRHHLGAADIGWIAAGAAGSVLIGLCFGAIMRLESRDGGLWAQMPVRGLWLWGALAAWRVVVYLGAAGMHAHIAASAAPLLFALGLNRLAQAGVLAYRSMAAGIPFAPDHDGHASDRVRRHAGSRWER